MRSKLLVIVPLLMLSTAGSPIHGQITSNPIPEPIDEARPGSRGEGCRAPARDARAAPRRPGRVAFRLGAAELRARSPRWPPLRQRLCAAFCIFSTATTSPSVYADVGAAFPNSVSTTGSRAASSASRFHPDFARNGLFYTVHSEKGPGNPKTPDFIPIGYGVKDVTFHNVITEWHATNPAANTVRGHAARNPARGSRRRQSDSTRWARWNSTRQRSRATPIMGSSTPAAAITASAMAADRTRAIPPRLSASTPIMTAILRIDPRSPSVTHGVKGLGDYTIPMANKFAADGDPKTLGEIYAYGFRNAHRISWDMADGTMFASDIGMDNIEEINIVRNGENYGWMKREGYFQNGRPLGGALNQLYPLPAEILDGRVEGRLHLSCRGLRPRRGPLGDGRLRVSRTHRRAARQVHLRRHPARAHLRLRPCRDEEGG